MSFRTNFFGFYDATVLQTLDALQLREQAISQNIANASNPNYHPVSVDFEEQLQEIVASRTASPDEKALQIKLDFDPEFHANASGIHPTITRSPVAHVDLNHEMAQLAKTQLLYNYMTDSAKQGWKKYIIENLTK